MPEKNKSENSNVLEKEPKLKKPKKYKVVLINDDFTPYEFVKQLIKKVFRKTEQEAEVITHEIHEKGSGICGIYTYEIAETKMAIVNNLAHKNQHPLTAIIDPE